jgi:GNAT superfamily N-acetyltransferase
MLEIRRISKNQLWEEFESRDTSIPLLCSKIQLREGLDTGLMNFILFGGDRLTCVDEVLAAYENGAFAGAVTLSPVGEMNTGKPSIVGLLVLKRLRRNGIGTKLMESAITRMRERGLTPVHIDILSMNAGKLVEKLDDDFKKCLVINDQSEHGDCFDLFESWN